jgi:glycosyltransferase involved in cell wall biosynthesis
MVGRFFAASKNIFGVVNPYRTPKPMKIVYDYQVFNDQTYGGPSRYICEMAKWTDKLLPGSQVKIFGGLHRNLFLPELPDRLVVGKRIPALPRTVKLMRNINDQLMTAWLARQSGIDIFHTSDYASVNRCPPGAKSVVTVHDMIHEKFRESAPTRYLAEIYPQTKAQAIRQADRIICISEHSKQDLIELLDIEPSKIELIYLGHSINATQPIDPHLDLGQEPFILYVGMRAWYKNFERTIRAYAQHPKISKDFRLLFCGTKPFNAGEQRLIESCGLPSDRIIYRGADDNTLAGFYQYASAFLYPSLYEGHGNSPLEAMAYGCPVVCTNTSAVPEVVGDAAELVDPYDIESISVGLAHVLYNSARAAELVARGRERIKLFTWARCGAEHARFYQNLAAKFP